MGKKAYLDSKTIKALIIIAAIVLINIMGVGESKPGDTYEGITNQNGRGVEQLKNILLLIGVGGAAYGRVTAKTELTSKKGLKDENQYGLRY